MYLSLYILCYEESKSSHRNKNVYGPEAEFPEYNSASEHLTSPSMFACNDFIAFEK